MSSSIVVASPRTDKLYRDPVLLLPLVVGAGLGVGWLGADARASGIRVAVDLALAWSLVAAALVALQRARWRRARILLVSSSFALLASDLRWARSDGLWTFGFLLASVWVALLVHFVLTFPEGRPWSRSASIAVAGAYAAAVGGQLAGVLVDPAPRDVLDLAASERLAEGIGRAQGAVGLAVGLAVAVLVGRKLLSLRGTARRAQAPLLAASLLALPAALLWLGWVIVTGDGAQTLETTARGIALLVPLGLVGGAAWSRLGRSEASALVVELQTEGAASLRDRLARVLGDPTLDVAYRLDDGRYVGADGRAVRAPAEREPSVDAAHGPGRGGRGARARPGVARRAGARRVGSCDGRARARERASRGGGARTARRGPGVAHPDRRVPPTQSGGASSATSTTARSSGSSRSPSRSGSPRRVPTR